MKIRSNVQSRIALMTQLRQDLHKIPELSCREFETQHYICAFLSSRKIPFFKIETGVVADLKGNNSGHRIAFRADIDALPIVEQTPVPYRAQNGNMHACGHDGHTAMLLTLCDILSESPPPCDVRAVFQFGEEGAGGADIMVRGGALEDVAEIYALHVDPALGAGEFASCSGPMMAGAVEFTVRFTGQAAHCAEPKLGVDALMPAAALLAKLPDFLKHDTLLHIGKVSGGTARNIIANESVCEGTLRYFSEADRVSVMGAIENFLAETDRRFGTKHALMIETVYPPLVNTEHAFGRVNAACGALQTAIPRYTAEDFAFYTQKIDGCLTWLGVKTDAFCAPLHADTFGFEEQTLAAGVELFLRLLDIDTWYQKEQLPQ